MASPNLINVSAKYGKTLVETVGSTNKVIAANPAISGKLIRVFSLYLANSNETQTGYITVYLYRANASIKLANKLEVAPRDTVVFITETAPLYLEEGDSLICQSTQTVVFNAICSYDVIG
jgi:hypothetical protein